MLAAGSILCSSILSGCGTVARYHQDRSIPGPTGYFDYGLVCKMLAREEARSENPARSIEMLDLSGKESKCLSAEKPLQIAEVFKQELLFEFIREALPPAWFAAGADPAMRFPLLRPHIEVTARNPEGAKESSKTFVTAMSDRGQQAVVDYLSKKSDDSVSKAAEGLLGALSKAGSKKESGNPYETRRQVPLLISTSFNSNNPADRLEKVYIFVRPLKGAKIVDVEKPVLETQREKVNLGKENTSLEMSSNFGLEGLAIGGGDAKGKLGLSPKFTQSLEKTLIKQFALRSVSLNPTRDILFVRQEGQEGIDISGNVLSSVTLEIPSAPSILDFFSVEQKESEQVIKRKAEALHNIGDIDALVAWVAVARIVDAGSNTVHEDDDVVRPQVFSGQFPVNLWRNDASFFSLRLEIRSSGRCQSVPLVFYDDIERRARRIVFGSFTEAQRFKTYLMRSTPKPPASAQAGRYPVPVDKETLGIGFPMASNGNFDESAVNLAWTGHGGDAKSKFANLYYDVTEPADFPIRSMLRNEECSN